MSAPLNPADLDRYASTYYLNADVDDIDLEEMAQRHSVPAIVRALEGCERVLELASEPG